MYNIGRQSRQDCEGKLARCLLRWPQLIVETELKWSRWACGLDRVHSCWRPRTFTFSGQSAREKGVLHTEKNSIVWLETSNLWSLIIDCLWKNSLRQEKEPSKRSRWVNFWSFYRAANRWHSPQPKCRPSITWVVSSEGYSLNHSAKLVLD